MLDTKRVNEDLVALSYKSAETCGVKLNKWEDFLIGCVVFQQTKPVANTSLFTATIPTKPF